MYLNKIEKAEKALEELYSNNPENKLKLIKDITNIAISEITDINVKFLSNSEFIKQLEGLADIYLEDEKFMQFLIRSFERIVTTIFYYAKLPNENYSYDTRNIYNICLKLMDAKNKNLKYWVASCITALPEFQNYEKKWEYLLSVPSLSPKEYSFVIFNRFVYNNFSTIPDEYRLRLIDTIKEFISDYPESYKANPKIYDETLSKLK